MSPMVSVSSGCRFEANEWNTTMDPSAVSRTERLWSFPLIPSSDREASARSSVRGSLDGPPVAAGAHEVRSSTAPRDAIRIRLEGAMAPLHGSLVPSNDRPYSHRAAGGKTPRAQVFRLVDGSACSRRSKKIALLRHVRFDTILVDRSHVLWLTSDGGSG